ncbi:hypothetical protein ACA910_006847 [Epithemia clementina (nom. ined.)]
MVVFSTLTSSCQGFSLSSVRQQLLDHIRQASWPPQSLPFIGTTTTSSITTTCSKERRARRLTAAIPNSHDACSGMDDNDDTLALSRNKYAGVASASKLLANADESASTPAVNGSSCSSLSSSSTTSSTTITATGGAAAMAVVPTLDVKQRMLQLVRQPGRRLGLFKKFWRFYLKSLQRRPLLTKAITEAAIQGLGDVLSQGLGAGTGGHGHHISSAAAATTASSLAFVVPYDLGRTISFGLIGFWFEGPFLHYWFRFVGRFGRRLQRDWALKKSQRVWAELLLDQTVGVVLYYPLCFFAYELVSSIAYGKVPDLAGVVSTHGLRNLIQAMQAQYLVFPVFGFISFTYVPESLRVAYNSFVSLIWNIFFCSMVAAER